MNKVRLQVIAPKRVIFDGECTMIEYNTTEGYVGVLPGHIAMTQILAPGRLTIYVENQERPIYLTAMSGIATIMPDTITLLTEISEFKEEIDVERAKAARERALKRLEEKLEKTDMVRATKALRRAETRLEVAAIE